MQDQGRVAKEISTFLNSIAVLKTKLLSWLPFLRELGGAGFWKAAFNVT